MKKAYWLRPRSNDVEISVVTDPVPYGWYRFTEGLKSRLRRARNVGRAGLGRGRGLHTAGAFRGHPAVTRSLVQGLEKLNVECTYNPKTLDELSQTVIVLSGVPALRQMIRLKQQGYIRRLLAGPNILNDPGSHGGILASPEIDLYVTHAPVCRLVERFLPALRHRCVAWAAGVDIEFWCPGGPPPKNRVLIYNKTNKGPTAPVAPYRTELERRGYEVSILEYGSYTASQYRNALRTSRFMLGFTRDESQGIAFAEAWACDVPTLMWRNSEPIYLGVAYHGSSAPYLTDATGAFFSTLEDFSALVSQQDRGVAAFTPRQWCSENMSDEVCAQNLLTITRSV